MLLNNIIAAAGGIHAIDQDHRGSNHFTYDSYEMGLAQLCGLGDEKLKRLRLRYPKRSWRNAGPPGAAVQSALGEAVRRLFAKAAAVGYAGRVCADAARPFPCARGCAVTYEACGANATRHD